MKPTDTQTAARPLQLFCQLASGRFSRLDYLDERKNRIKFVLRSLLTPRGTLAWLSFISQRPRLLDYLRQAPRIALKLHRPYQHCALDTQGKLASLKSHYAAVLTLPEQAREALLSRQNLTLASVEGKDETRFGCRMGHNHYFDKEGELVLQWLEGEDTPLATLTFTVCEQDDKTVIVIGGLQGPHKDYGAEGIKTATKACHGLFPKRLVVEALMVVAEAFKAVEVRAVCKDQHIYSSWRYNRDFQADYDSFWESLGSERADSVFFRLPFPIPRKPMEDIASKKRSEYNRRYALLDDLAAQIRQTLSH